MTPYAHGDRSPEEPALAYVVIGGPKQLPDGGFLEHLIQPVG
jgi:hypothetical protein